MAEVDIYNAALIKLGEKTITTVDDDVKAARTLKEIYAQQRDLELRKHIWNFAKVRDELDESSSAPDFGFTYSYDLPDDFLRLVYPDRSIWAYAIEGDKLLTDYPSGYVVYIAQITDTDVMDVSFKEVLACKLAMEVCVALADDNVRLKDLAALYVEALREARTVNAMDDGPKWLESETWLDSRLAGVAGPRGIREGLPGA